MFERNGEQYFVVDGHVHFWDASPANRVKGHEQYAEGWINSRCLAGAVPAQGARGPQVAAV